MLKSNIIFFILGAILFDNALGQGSSYASSSSSSSSSSYASSSSYIIPRQPNNCLAACPTVYDPVCATNGRCYKTFGNECLVGSGNCNSSEKFIIVADGECENQVVFRPLCECNFICTLEYAPVCASNGKCYSTFGNSCALKGYNKCYPYDYFFEIHKGECSFFEIPKCY